MKISERLKLKKFLRSELKRHGDTLDAHKNTSHTFSDEFIEKETALFSRRSRPNYKLKYVIPIAIVFTLLCGCITASALSPTVRQFFHDTFMQIFTGTKDPQNHMDAKKPITDLSFAYIPDGFSLVREEEMSGVTLHIYQNVQGQILTITVERGNVDKGVDNEDITYNTVMVDGKEAFVGTKAGGDLIALMKYNDQLSIEIVGPIDESTASQILASATPVN